MARAYFVAAKNDGEKRFLETCENNSIVSKFYPLGDLDLDHYRKVPSRVAELSYYANAIASKMYGRNEWCEFRDKMKAIALKYDPDLMDFGKYDSLMQMKRDDYPIE